MKYEEATIPVCSECINITSLELINQQAVDKFLKSCAKCGIEYCLHYASSTDTNFCGNCLADFHVVETIETKTTEHVNAAGEVTYTRRQTAKKLTLEGTDWLFAAAKIPDLSDEELISAIEYHRAIASTMLMEREQRKLERYKKLSQIKIITPTTRKPMEQDELDALKSGKPFVRAKTVTRTKSSVSAEQAMEMVKKLQAVLSPEALAALLKGVK